MAVPTKYNPSYSYTGFESDNPASPKPGAQLDNDFADISQSLDETIDALSEIRRSDGALANGVVTPDSLSAGLVMGFTVEGQWTDGAVYDAADGVTYGTSFYKARVAHTAAPATRPDLDATTWAFLFTFDSIAVGDNAVTTAKIADGAVTTIKIADANVTGAKLVDGAVTAAKIGDSEVSSAKLATGSVTATKIADGVVSNAKIVDEAINAAKIAADAVTTAKILDANVTTAKIANLGVTSAKLADAAVTAAKIAAGAVVDTIIIPVVAEATTVTTGTAERTFRMPYAFKLTAVRASLTTVSSSGIPTVDINESGVSILSTKLTIDANEKSSTTAATAAVISDTDLADDAEITIDVDVAGTGAKGLKVYMIGYRV